MGLALQGDIQCVDKDALKDKDVVQLELKDTSSCVSMELSTDFKHKDRLSFSGQKKVHLCAK